MGKPVAVVTDTTTYLPRKLADKEGIHQVSLYVGWQDDQRREIELDGFDAFYERLRTDPDLPTTSQPSIGDFLAVWEPLLKAGQDIVSIHLAGGISGTCESARQAQSLLIERGLGERIEVIDGETACGGLGMVLLAAAAAAHKGADKDAVAARAHEARAALKIWFCVQHARVPAPWWAHRQRPGVDRQHAQDQANPLARLRNHACRAGAHRQARV